MALGKRRAEAIITVIGEDQFTAMMDDLKNDVGNKVGGAVKDVNKNWAVMATGVKSVVDLVGQAAGAALKLVGVMKEAGQSIAIEQMFRRAHKNADALMVTLREVTGFQIDDTSLQGFATKARIAGLSIKETAETLNLATKVANATGRENVATAESFLDALVKGNDRAFKTVGINVDLSLLYDQHAKSIGKTRAELKHSERLLVGLPAVAKKVSEEFKHIRLQNTLIADVNQAEAEMANFLDTAKRKAAEAAVFTGKAFRDNYNYYVKPTFKELAIEKNHYIEISDLFGDSVSEANKHLKAQGVALADMPELLLTAADKTALLADGQRVAAEKADILARSYRALAESAREFQRVALRESTAEDKEFFTKGSGAEFPDLQPMVKKPKRGRGGGRGKKDLGRFGALTGPIDEILEKARAENEAWDRLQAAHYKATQELLQEQHEFKVRNKKEWDAELEEMEKAHIEIMEGFNKRSLDRAFASLTDAGEILGEGWAGVGGRIAEGLGPATAAIGGIIDQTQTLIENGANASDAWGDAAIGMAKVTANFVGDVAESEGLRAAMMAMIETAEAWRSFAGGKYAAGAMHVVAAGLYTAASIQAFSVAGSKGKGGRRGGGATARRAGGVPSANASMGGGPGDSAPGQMITINYNGTTFAAREQFDREVRHANTRVDANQSIPMWSQA
jgi:hypothetical protein